MIPRAWLIRPASISFLQFPVSLSYILFLKSEFSLLSFWLVNYNHTPFHLRMIYHCIDCLFDVRRHSKRVCPIQYDFDSQFNIFRNTCAKDALLVTFLFTFAWWCQDTFHYYQSSFFACVGRSRVAKICFFILAHVAVISLFSRIGSLVS